MNTIKSVCLLQNKLLEDSIIIFSLAFPLSLTLFSSTIFALLYSLETTRVSPSLGSFPMSWPHDELPDCVKCHQYMHPLLHLTCRSQWIYWFSRFLDFSCDGGYGNGCWYIRMNKDFKKNDYKSINTILDTSQDFCFCPR